MTRLWGIDITGSFVFTPGAAGVGTLQFVGQTLSLEQLLVVTNATRNEALCVEVLASRVRTLPVKPAEPAVGSRKL